MFLWIFSAAKKPSFHQKELWKWAWIFITAPETWPNSSWQNQVGLRPSQTAETLYLLPLRGGPRATDASGTDVRMELMWDPIWILKHCRVVSQTLEQGLKKNHSVSKGKLIWSYMTEREPHLEAPIQEPTQLGHWLKAEGMVSGGEGSRRGFSNKGKKAFWENLVLWF